jgi:hypothetical protein
MHETDSELDELQTLLDTSLSRSTEHLRSIVKPGEHTLSARQLVGVITGMRTLSLATVTAGGEPRISAVDGHFLHGSWIFTTARSAAKARQMAARPAVSAAYLRGEEIGVFTHGAAELLNPAGGPDDPGWPAILDHLTRHYGQSPMEWGDVVGYRLRPHWMVVYASKPAELIASQESPG